MVKDIKKPKQVGRYSDSERELIKGIFAENDELLIMLRKVFIQAPLKKSEVDLLRRTFVKGSDAYNVFKKTMYPEIIPDTPLFMMVDLWSILEIEIKDKPLEMIHPYLVSNVVFTEYLKNQFNFFEGVEIGGLAFEYLSNVVGKTDIDAFAQLHARNRLLSFIDNQLNQLKVLAGFKEESLEATKQRLSKDSSK